MGRTRRRGFFSCSLGEDVCGERWWGLFSIWTVVDVTRNGFLYAVSESNVSAVQVQFSFLGAVVCDKNCATRTSDLLNLVSHRVRKRLSGCVSLV